MLNVLFYVTLISLCVMAIMLMLGYGKQVTCSHKYTISSTGYTHAGLLREKMRCEHCNKTVALPVRG